MRKMFIVLFLLSSLILYSQQDSKINIGVGNGNQVSVIQIGKDSSQNSEFSIEKGDCNNVNIKQLKSNQVQSIEEPSAFVKFITNTNTIVSIIFTLLSIMILFKAKFLKKK